MAKGSVEDKFKFLSTPSVRRATLSAMSLIVRSDYFYPRPP